MPSGLCVYANCVSCGLRIPTIDTCEKVDSGQWEKQGSGPSSIGSMLKPNLSCQGNGVIPPCLLPRNPLLGSWHISFSVPHIQDFSLLMG